MRIRSLFLFVVFVCFGVQCLANPASYEINSSRLSEGGRDLFYRIQETINDFPKENDKVVSLETMINSFIKSEPNFLPIYIEQARFLIINGYRLDQFVDSNKQALGILTSVQRKQPNYPKAYVLAGHVYLNIGDIENSRRSLEQAQRLGTNDPWLYNNWADLFARMRQYREAVEYAKKALLNSGDNAKALVGAVDLITRYSEKAGVDSSDLEIKDLVFSSFKSPSQRLRIATRLIGAYSGNSDILSVAYRIIESQKIETPNLQEVDLAKARWFLAKGFRVERNHVSLYEPGSAREAERLLDGLGDSKSLVNDIFSLKLEILFSRNDLDAVYKLIADAERNGLPANIVLPNKALVKWIQGDYDSVVDIYEGLAKQDPAFRNSPLLMHAYGRLGDLDRLSKYYKNQVEKNPTDAWTLGNYASFLLFRLDDIDGAISYGEKALAEMRYPLGINVTSLAYLMKAATLKRKGDASGALKNYKRANVIGYDKAYVNEHCGGYCVEIRQMWNVHSQGAARRT